MVKVVDPFFNDTSESESGDHNGGHHCDHHLGSARMKDKKTNNTKNMGLEEAFKVK
jgi:hypothetical protein